jgi:hypothetical protein
VKAGNYHNPMLLNFKEYSVGKAPHSRTPTASMNHRELQWMLG